MLSPRFRRPKDPPPVTPQRAPDENGAVSASADKRNATARVRDEAAQHRDDAAELRDRQADAHDYTADVLDGVDARLAETKHRRAPEDRAQAASERSDASADRGMAATDRAIAKSDRAASAAAALAADDELYRSQELFRQGFENARVGMAVTKPLGRGYARVNRAMCRMLDRDESELLAAGSIADFTHPDDALAERTAIERVLSGEQEFDEREKCAPRPDGSTIWVSRHLTPLRGPSGTIDAVFVQLVDISAQKKREETLSQRVDEVTWIARIRDALDQDRFVLYAQPIVDLETDTVVRHEVLLRMRGGADEIIAPIHFLPTAEKYGMIEEIDRWVISQTTKLAAQGHAVEVNLSGGSICSPALLDVLEHELGKPGAEPGNLVFEITETALMHNLDAGALFAQRLVALGCRFALDDFGTGYGSFTYLKRLPVQYLKIDIQFVRDLIGNERDRHLVRAIVALASGFGLQTIAEGVEDEPTLELLRELGVNAAQGYHLGRPAPLPLTP